VTPTLYWVRKDFRLSDNAALDAAIEGDGSVIPVCILDEVVEGYGAAPKWRWGKAAEAFASTLEGKGSRLILRRGNALSVLRELIAETGAKRVIWGRQYDREAKTRDTKVKAELKKDGVDAISVRNHLLFEPWDIETKTGGPYRVYTPFKNACLARDISHDATSLPSTLPSPAEWPKSDSLDAWALDAEMNRGAEIVSHYAAIGEDAARGRLGAFIKKIADYGEARDRPSVIGTSRLSENLAWGEISPLTIWRTVRGSADSGTDGAKVYLSEILWREFAYHLTHHYPNIIDANWRDEWDAFPWREDNEDAERWRRGMTGIPFVDAALRELYTTGIMHNRLRMLTASLLTKHLMTDWRVGERWFSECLIDWDPASNAMGWQWAAGSGPDASPFFRIFNPETQATKFDPKGSYIDKWIAEKAPSPREDGRNFFAAIPRIWDMSADQPYPDPIVDLKAGRERALAAYKEMRA
jgi:deoxyribodipyrimidine photo-lyase